MTRPSSEAPTVGLGRLLAEGNRFVVPHHQRDYSWTEDELGQLFLDIEEARSTGSEYYFLGLMVFIPGESGEYIILDGQQRMATTVIILSAIRTWLRGYNYERDAEQIQEIYIASRELGEDDLTPRLVLNETNNRHFFEYIITERPIADIDDALSKLKRHDPNRRLLEALSFCRTKVAELAIEHSDPTKAARILFDLAKYLRDKVQVVRLTVPSEADAYTVFETLNDRGLDLTVLDLVKNNTFGKISSKSRLQEARNRWAQMMATLSNVRGDDFLKVYWTSRHGRTQKAQLFQSIKRHYKSEASIIQFSVDLLESSEYYAAIELSDDPIWAGYSEIARERIRTLKMLRSQSVHPVLLSGLVKFNRREMERLLSLMEVLIVRYQLIGGGRTGLLEIAAAKLAADIFDGKVTSATRALQGLKEIFPSDDQFREAFLSKQERTKNKVQYLLRNLEEEARKRSIRGPAGAEWRPKYLTVEHVLPQNAGAEWATELADDKNFADDCTYRLGNMVLLSSVNKDLGRSGFAAKRTVFVSSTLYLTKAVGTYIEWNRKAVEERQAHMAKLAVGRWRFH